MESLIYLSEHRVIILPLRRQGGNLLSSKQHREMLVCRAGRWLSCRNTTVPNLNNVLMPELHKEQPEEEVLGVSMK